METSVKITLIIVGAVILLGLIGIGIFYDLSPGQTVQANGEAQLKVNPDVISVYFNIQTQGTNATYVKDKNAEISDNVLVALIKLGLERKDIVTESFNIYPDYYGSNYRATNQLRVILNANQTDKIGQVIDAGVNAGALISYINFELSLEKQNEYKALALKQAGEDAKKKAAATAAGLGKRLGKLVSVSNSNFNYYPWQIYRNDAMAVGSADAKLASTNIHPGQQDVSAYVSVVYKIK